MQAPDDASSYRAALPCGRGVFGSAENGAANEDAQRPEGFRADLHLHSAFSDGLYTPDELCRLAVKYHVDCVALTDHDTAAGLSAMRAAAETCGLLFLSGVEVSTGMGGRVHVLCYGLDENCAPLADFLAKAGADRQARAAEMLRRLQSAGVSLGDEENELLSNPCVGRAHIARALVRAGAVKTVPEAFERFLAEGKCAYVPRKHLATGDVIAKLAQMGGAVALAHPLRSGFTEKDLRALLPEWRSRGLCAVEAFHPSAGAGAARRLEHMARDMGLIVTGGSDFHGEPNARVRVGRLPAGWNACREDVRALEQVFSSTSQRSHS